MRALRRAAAGFGRLLAERRFADIMGIIVQRTPRSLLHVDCLYVTELVRTTFPARRRQDQVLRRLTPADLTELRTRFASDPDAVSRRLAKGDVGLGCEVDRRLVAMLWLNFGPQHDEPDKFCRFRIGEDSAWGYDLMILPGWQMSGLFVTLVEGAYAEALRRGRRRLLGWTSWYNRSSFNAHVRIGHELVARVFVLNLLGFRLHYVRSVANRRAPATRLGIGSRPILDVATPGDPTRTSSEALYA